MGTWVTRLFQYKGIMVKDESAAVIQTFLKIVHYLDLQ